MRKKMIESDVVEAVIGLGPNLFYNSPMEACILVCNKGKKKDRQGKILFINAVNEVKRKNAFSYLTDEHIKKIHQAFVGYNNIEGFAKVMSIKDVLTKNGNLNIPLYVSNVQQTNGQKKVYLTNLLQEWEKQSRCLQKDLKKLFETIASGL